MIFYISKEQNLGYYSYWDIIASGPDKDSQVLNITFSYTGHDFRILYKQLADSETNVELVESLKERFRKAAMNSSPFIEVAIPQFIQDVESMFSDKKLASFDPILLSEHTYLNDDHREKLKNELFTFLWDYFAPLTRSNDLPALSGELIRLQMNPFRFKDENILRGRREARVIVLRVRRELNDKKIIQKIFPAIVPGVAIMNSIKAVLITHGDSGLRKFKQFIQETKPQFLAGDNLLRLGRDEADALYADFMRTI